MTHFTDTSAFYGVVSVINILFLLVCIYVTWICLCQARWDKFFYDPSDIKARGFVLILAILIGTMLADFFTKYLTNAVYLQFLF